MDKKCVLCGRRTNLELHHLLRGSQRKMADKYKSPHWKMIVSCPACSRFIQRYGCNRRLVVNECIEVWNNYDGLIKINRNWKM